MPFPAGLDGVVLHSHGCKLLGGFYRAQGETPRPTVVLLHGIPGVEKNLDLASALREAGCNVLYFHYRGCWGSEGEYTITGQLADVRAATDWVLGQACVDGSRLALVGYSLGGYMALAAVARDVRLSAVVALCPLIDPAPGRVREARPTASQDELTPRFSKRATARQPATDRLTREDFDSFATMVNGASGPDLERQWRALTPITQLAPQLRGRSLMLATGDRDELFPPAHYEPLERTLTISQRIRFAEGDHSLSLCRSAMIQSVVEWLTHGTGWVFME